MPTRRARVYPAPENFNNTVDGPSKCYKYTIFFFNAFFWLGSVLVLLVGAALLAENRPAYSGYKDIAFDPVAVCTAFGFLLFVITFTGCVGALRENAFLLRIFTVLLGLIIFLEISGVALGFYYQGTIQGQLETRLQTAIVFYRDDKKEDLRYLIDSTQVGLECCGLKSYDDWELNLYFNCSSPAHESCGVPFSCCKNIDNNRQCGLGVRQQSVNYSDRRDRIYTNGCVSKLITWFKDNLIALASVGAIVLFMQFINLFLAYTFRDEIVEMQN